VEHNMSVVMSICDRIVVINFGMKIAEGLAEEVRSNPEVIQAYLGSGYAS
jgi:branched-chain amino acid transport system ATP-binding protein